MKRFISIFGNENLVGTILSIITFCVYITTLSNSVGFTDSGELATVVCTLGIAHPTGYPLFTLLGRCWMMLPFPLEEIVSLNLFSAFLVSIAVGLFFKTTLVIRRASSLFHLNLRLRNKSSDTHFFFSSAIASLTLGFSTTFWSQSAQFDVFALHLVLVILATWTFIAGLEEQVNVRHHISRKLILFAFIFGFSFSNHMTTILLVPGFLWLYFNTFGFGKESLLRILKIIPFFILGLSIYLYLPIRSVVHPLLDWGHPVTFERLLWHVSGKQYRIWMFSGWDVIQKQSKYYLTNFSSEFNIFALIFVIIGLLKLWTQSKRLFIFFFLLFLTTVFYSVNYDIFDIETYFLLSYLIVGWIIAQGINATLEIIEDRKLWISTIVMIIIMIVPIIQFMNNWEYVNQTKNYLPQQFVHNSFNDLLPNAVVLATQWDYFISPSLYYQFIRNERRDITIIDKSLLQNRSWYFTQLEYQVPWLFDRIDESARVFLGELYKFEHNKPFNFTVIQACWQNLLSDIIKKSIPDHPVYVDARIEQEFPHEYLRNPAGFFIQLKNEVDTVGYRSVNSSFKPRNRNHPVVKDFEQYYITMLLYNAEWLRNHKENDRAKIMLLEAQRIDPDNATINWLLGRLIK